MRTDEEILARIDEIKKADFFGDETSDLIIRLPFDRAKPFLKDTAKEDEWKVEPRDRPSLLDKMEDYMSFAWNKANNERGLSASRSMSHYSAWTWLLGDDIPDLHGYEFYGKDNLVMLCDHYGWDHTQWDDGRRVNTG